MEAREAADFVDDGKLRPATPRVEWIDRARLVDRLAECVRSPVTLIAAPAGYGKTTLVSQWFTATDHAFAVWVALDPSDNDPTRLWSAIATGLEGIGCWAGQRAVEFVASNSTALLTRTVPRVLDALATASDQLTVVLDDCHVIRSADCCEQLDYLIEHLPANAHLVLIARADPPLRLGRLRVDGRLAEIRSRDLAFSRTEVASVLALRGVELGEAALTDLTRRTEGWPAAVQLSALSLDGRDRPDDFVDGLSGSNRFIADYLSEEVLNRQPDEIRAFILDLSLFERFTAALGDHVRESHSSARLIRELERADLFLLQLDGAGEWFRFHHLFGSLARSLVESECPDRPMLLHARAVDWFAGRGMVDEAVDHALQAGESPRAAELVAANWLRYFDAGRSATVLGWLDRLNETDAAAAPSTTVAAAWMAALTGDRAELTRRLGRLERMKGMEPALALIRGLFGFDGPSRMLADARRAVELESNRSSPWYATAQAALGHAWYVVGDIDRAAGCLTSAVDAPSAPAVIKVLALGTLALCEAEAGRDDACQVAADRAMRVAEANGLLSSPEGVLAFTALGVARAAAGRPDDALVLFDEGLHTRRQVSGLSPWPMIHHLIAMAPTVARTGQQGRAEQLLAEARGLCAWPDDTMGAMRGRLSRARSSVFRRELHVTAPGEPLTRRELEVLRKLDGPDSLSEVAGELFVSRNTVKTLTAGLYRKLGAHSREEAVRLARNSGLLTADHDSPG